MRFKGQILIFIKSAPTPRVKMAAVTLLPSMGTSLDEPKWMKEEVSTGVII